VRRATAATVVLAAGAVLVGALAPPALAQRPSRRDVVAAFYPLAWAAEQVGGGRVRVANLTPAGAEPHDLELTPDQRDAIEDAALVVVLGDGFQPAVEDAAADRDGRTVRMLSELDLATDDPHVWLDPVLMADVVGEVATALTKADRRHAAEYRANAAEVLADLAALDAEFATGLADCERDVVVTAHDAFGHLTKRYGLHDEGVAGISPDAEPNPDRLADLADLVRREGVTTVFTEELASPKIARTLAREAGGVKTAVLNPLEGLTDEQLADGADYLSEMRENLAALERALGCS
jgi:zinc transport system substrate-binding protein